MTSLPTTSDLQRLWPYLKPSERRRLELLLASQARAAQQRTERGKAHGFLAWCEATTPNYNFSWPHIQYIGERLERLRNGTLTDDRGRPKDRIAISVPPRHGKSETGTVRFPAWNLCERPTDRVLIGGHTQRFINGLSRKARRITKAQIPLSSEVNGAEEWETAEHGGLRAVGVGVGVAGVGANLALVDDPIRTRRDANSRTYRDMVWDWLRDDFITRLEPGAPLGIIMTRWHFDDPVGRLEKSEDADRWLFINLPALAEEGDPLGRAPGEALCPDRYDAPALLRLRHLLGNSFEALFQGRPAPIEGSIFNLRAFGRYDLADAPRRPLMTVLSVDCANKGSEFNDFSVIQTWAVTRTGVYLLHVWRKRVDYPTLKRAVVTLADTFQVNGALIEDKGNGQALIQEVRGTLPVIPIEPVGDKVVRAMAETIMVQAGLVNIPHSAPWLGDFEAEIVEFPSGENDDQVDATTQLLRWVRTQSLAIEFERLGVPRAGVEAWELDQGAEQDRQIIDTAGGFARLRSRPDTGGF